MKNGSITITLTILERDAIIAAIRLLSNDLRAGNVPNEIEEILGDSGSSLCHREIDLLGDRINVYPDHDQEHGPDNPCDDRGCDICNPPDDERAANLVTKRPELLRDAIKNTAEMDVGGVAP